MKDLREVVNQYSESYELIFKAFDCIDSLQIKDFTHERWFHDGFNLKSLDEQGDEMTIEFATKMKKTVDNIEMYQMDGDEESYYCLYSLNLNLTESEYNDNIGVELW